MFTVIQGAADVGTQLSEDEIQRSLDFCVKLFDPSTVDGTPEIREGLLGIPEELLDVSAPVIDPKRLSEATQVGRTVASESEGAHAETEMLLHKINARRVMQAEYAINNLEKEPLEGLTVRLARGNLGLNKA
jgi:flavine halogenase